VLHGILFAVSIAGVLKLLPYPICLVITLIALLIFDRKIILKVDYSLLLTFVGFFIFVGNMGRIPIFKEFIENMISGREVVFSALASQVISNVPAALLLSGFSENYSALLIGVNIGGLGTLIASMASLISYKYIAAAMPESKGKYFLIFTVVNFVLLLLMLGLNIIIGLF
jgi:Na+/H+ antiporter NhaD/arsenite permease-like protein